MSTALERMRQEESRPIHNVCYVDAADLALALAVIEATQADIFTHGVSWNVNRALSALTKDSP